MIMHGDLRMGYAKLLDFVVKMIKFLKDPATYLILICVILTIRAIQLNHYDVMVIWAGWAIYYLYEFFINDNKK